VGLGELFFVRHQPRLDETLTVGERQWLQHGEVLIDHFSLSRSSSSSSSFLRRCPRRVRCLWWERGPEYFTAHGDNICDGKSRLSSGLCMRGHSRNGVRTNQLRSSNVRRITFDSPGRSNSVAFWRSSHFTVIAYRRSAFDAEKGA